MHIEED